MSELEVILPLEQVEQIVDGFAESSSVVQIAHRTGFSPEQIRRVLDDPAVIRKALQRKAGKMALFTYGRGLDKLKEIVEQSDSPSASINALKEIRSMLTSVAPDATSHTPEKTLEGTIGSMGG